MTKLRPLYNDMLERSLMLEEALLGMLNQFGGADGNPALSDVENSCKLLGHPHDERWDKCYCAVVKLKPKLLVTTLDEHAEKKEAKKEEKDQAPQQ